MKRGWEHFRRVLQNKGILLNCPGSEGRKICIAGMRGGIILLPEIPNGQTGKNESLQGVGHCDKRIEKSRIGKMEGKGWLFGVRGSRGMEKNREGWGLGAEERT